MTALGVTGWIACVLILLVLSQLFEEVLEQQAFEFDREILLWINQWSTPVLDQVMLLVTRLGNPATFMGVVAGSLIWMVMTRGFPEAIVFLVACVGGGLLNQEMKLFFARQRPQLWERLVNETTFSFPSGHAMGSLIVYGLLAYILATELSRQAGWIYGAATLLIGAIGFSRLYLGVHWPTDVIAGYGVGFLWVVVCIVLLKLYWLRKASRRAEPPSNF